MPLITHDLAPPDAQAMQELRASFASAPKLTFAPESREAYDQIIGQVPLPSGVRFEAGEVGGVPGWWARPSDAKAGTAILYLHGGGYVLGSAKAYRNFVGEISKRSGSASFIADYALAPERPFPAASDDVQALHRGLFDAGYDRIALCGDSAGGGLVISFLTQNDAKAGKIVAAVAMSPWLDLTLSGSSMTTKADQDPLLSKEMLATATERYLNGQSTRDPRLNVLGSNLAAMPPLRIHVGDAEVLRDDSIRFAKKADAAGLGIEVHVWEGMIHVFPSNFAMLQASEAALKDISSFLAQHLGTAAKGQT
ncbi:alpha/beta hydrolase [Bradyrhizobium sp. BR 10289]|uniref:alpha/beta hydrolase n=1 Tax=Bradyrhizobium sp. BR 10289 TaxID=2749993 RepID=UPI001C64C2B3|nr:alpha/beta hydrolase [Bradyrhizobium sp. BR 10289]MBW7970208.1 alpha/beta hydrolase [Bradyrhizobium sp. BR 10289]